MVAGQNNELFYTVISSAMESYIVDAHEYNYYALELGMWEIGSVV